MNPIQNYIKQIRNLCASHNVKSLIAFGSSVTGTLSEHSDMDLLVDFEDLEPQEYAENYFDLKFSLEELFQRSVDLLEAKAITNPFLKQSIEKTKFLVYGNGG